MEDAHSVAAAGGDTEVSAAITFFSYAQHINYLQQIYYVNV